MPERRAIGQFAVGTWVRRADWRPERRACVVSSRDELVALMESIDPEVAYTARRSIGESFPLLVEAYGCDITWTDEMCVEDAVATDWEPSPWPCWTAQGMASQRIGVGPLRIRLPEDAGTPWEPESRRRSTAPYK